MTKKQMEALRSTMRNTVEFAIAGGSFMVALMCLCLSYLAQGFWGPVWATIGLGSMAFCLLWCFNDVIDKMVKR